MPTSAAASRAAGRAAARRPPRRHGRGRRSRARRGGARRRRRGPRAAAAPAHRMRTSAAQPRLEQRLALLAALAARALGAAEEVSELVVARALGVLHVLLDPQHVAEALLREPDDVVVLVGRARDLARFAA